MWKWIETSKTTWLNYTTTKKWVVGGSTALIVAGIGVGIGLGVYYGTKPAEQPTYYFLGEMSNTTEVAEEDVYEVPTYTGTNSVWDNNRTTYSAIELEVYVNSVEYEILQDEPLTNMSFAIELKFNAVNNIGTPDHESISSTSYKVGVTFDWTGTSMESVTEYPLIGWGINSANQDDIFSIDPSEKGFVLNYSSSYHDQIQVYQGSFTIVPYTTGNSTSIVSEPKQIGLV